MEILNKRARFDYFIEEEIEAGEEIKYVDRYAVVERRQIPRYFSVQTPEEVPWYNYKENIAYIKIEYGIE